MVNRIYIVTLIILFFLSVGRASVRADILMVVNSVMLDSVIKPDEWREVYRWVLADKNDVNPVSLWEFRQIDGTVVLSERRQGL